MGVDAQTLRVEFLVGPEKRNLRAEVMIEDENGRGVYVEIIGPKHKELHAAAEALVQAVLDAR